jgi:hypothetical protein
LPRQRQPLLHPHPAGAPLRFYAGNAKSLVGANQLIAEEFARGWLLDQVLPSLSLSLSLSSLSH